MARFEIKMPKLGESITEGTILSWSVQVGDVVNEDDVLFEVNTAKVSAEIPSPVAGKVVEILFKEGDTVPVGTVVAIVDMDGECSGIEVIFLHAGNRSCKLFLCGRAVADYYNVIKHFRVFAQVYYKLCLISYLLFNSCITYIRYNQYIRRIRFYIEGSINSCNRTICCTFNKDTGTDNGFICFIEDCTSYCLLGNSIIAHQRKYY